MAGSISSVLSKVPGAAKKIAGKPLGVTSKVLGAAAIASVLYDAHVNGSERADSYDSVATAKKMTNDYKQYSTMNRKSATVAKLKKCWYKGQQCTSFFHFGNRLTGYVGEFCSTVLNNLPKLALAGAALAFKNVGKAAGVVLAADAAKTMLFDVAGIGTKKKKI